MNNTTPMLSSLIDGKEVLLNGISAAYNNCGVIPITEEITREYAAEICALIYMSKRPIVLAINSPGGEVFSALSICNAIRTCGYEVSTCCEGIAYSAASLVLAAGSPGHRYCIPDGDVMIHQCIGSGVSGQASDILIQADHTKRVNEKVCRKLADLTGQPYEQIIIDVDRNNYMTPEMAQEYGIIDHIGTPENYYQ